MELIIEKNNQSEQAAVEPVKRILLTPLYIRRCQARYYAKPEVQEMRREQHKLRERVLKQDPDYKKICNKRSLDSYHRKQARIKKEQAEQEQAEQEQAEQQEQQEQQQQAEH